MQTAFMFDYRLKIIIAVSLEASNGALQQLDFGLFRNAQPDGLFLNAGDLADDAADGIDFIANVQGVDHIVMSFLLFFLRTDQQYIEENADQYNVQNSSHHSAVCQSIHHLLLIAYCIIFYMV